MKRKLTKSQKKWMLIKIALYLIGLGIIIAGFLVIASLSKEVDIILHGGPKRIIAILLWITGAFIILDTINWEYRNSRFYKNSKKTRH